MLVTPSTGWNKGLTPIDVAVLNALWNAETIGGFGDGTSLSQARKRDMLTLGVGYKVTPQLNIGGHYYYARQKGRISAGKGHAQFLVAIADYAFSKRTDAYFEVDHTKLSRNLSLKGRDGNVNGARSRTGITIGLRHRF